jgi:hypothetical protein
MVRGTTPPERPLGYREDVEVAPADLDVRAADELGRVAESCDNLVMLGSLGATLVPIVFGASWVVALLFEFR